MTRKPLGRRAYGSIPHLPGSRTGPSDHHIPVGLANILTVNRRDEEDHIFVWEKLDGTCMAVAKVDGRILPLNRRGYLASSSPYENQQRFVSWVHSPEVRKRFDSLLRDGDRIVGEWLAQATGTLYDMRGREPFVAFDLMCREKYINPLSGKTVYYDGRILTERFLNHVAGTFRTPKLLHVGTSLPVAEAMRLAKQYCGDDVEGVVYRCERDCRVEFLAKWVRPDKVDGKYLPEISGQDPVWLWPV